MASEVPHKHELPSTPGQHPRSKATPRPVPCGHSASGGCSLSLKTGQPLPVPSGALGAWGGPEAQGSLFYFIVPAECLQTAHFPQTEFLQCPLVATLLSQNRGLCGRHFLPLGVKSLKIAPAMLFGILHLMQQI